MLIHFHILFDLKRITLFINSLVVSGNPDSATYYAKVFKKQFPHINLGEVMLEVEKDYKSEPNSKIVDLSKNNITKKEMEAPSQTPKKKNKNIIVKIQDLFDRVKEDISSPINENTLQEGAIGKKSNAEYQ